MSEIAYRDRSDEQDWIGSLSQMNVQSRTLLLRYACQDRDRWTRLVFLEPSAELFATPRHLIACHLQWEENLVYCFAGMNWNPRLC